MDVVDYASSGVNGAKVAVDNGEFLFEAEVEFEFWDGVPSAIYDDYTATATDENGVEEKFVVLPDDVIDAIVERAQQWFYVYSGEDAA